MATSKELAEKSVHAAVAAIEVYNKPDFHYREEAFSLLMTNAWELLLKAKWLLDHQEDLMSLCEWDGQPDGTKTIRKNRCGNPITFGLLYLAAKLSEDTNSGLEKACCDNLHALVEIRDNAVHLINKDLTFGRRVLEIGTASLQNYLHLAREWFQSDLSRYNFFLMPLSFYHGFEVVQAASVAPVAEQVQKLLNYLDKLQEEQSSSPDSAHQHFALRLETKLSRSKVGDAVAFRWTDDPKAPTVALREEDVLKNYPLTYRQLSDTLHRRYSDFLENPHYHRLRKRMERERKFCIERLLDPRNPKSSRQKFFNPNILAEFDKHYTKRTRSLNGAG